jgi:methylenetetrahydrofolate dehydrogenase (NADP+)/methenyltetrahydrofolate cyclohydrolase
MRAHGRVAGVRFSCQSVTLKAGTRMPAKILDGTKIANDIRREVAAEVKAMAAGGVRPGLAVVLVGHNPASEIYVRGKVKACEEVGIYSEEIAPAESATTEELVALIEQLNQRAEVDGILVQLPLPAQVDAKKVLMAVDPAKDVDGFHPVNVGFLSTQREGLIPCTPAGVMEILKRSGIPVAGQEAVIVGRSDIVGKPAAMLLLNANSTVTVCHSKTRNLPQVCRRADILVAAIGRAGIITREFVKPGATVIDVGMNKVTEPEEFKRLFAGSAKREESFRTKGSTLVGDVHPEVAEVAGALTPVPGGVGPLTIAMLMYNTVKAAKLRRGSYVPVVTSR